MGCIVAKPFTRRPRAKHHPPATYNNAKERRRPSPPMFDVKISRLEDNAITHNTDSPSVLLVSLSVCLSVCLLFVRLFVCLFFCLSIVSAETHASPAAPATAFQSTTWPREWFQPSDPSSTENVASLTRKSRTSLFASGSSWCHDRTHVTFRRSSRVRTHVVSQTHIDTLIHPIAHPLAPYPSVSLSASHFLHVCLSVCLPVCVSDLKPEPVEPSAKAATLAERLQATYELDNGLSKKARKKRRKKILIQMAKEEQGKSGTAPRVRNCAYHDKICACTLLLRVVVHDVQGMKWVPIQAWKAAERTQRAKEARQRQQAKNAMKRQCKSVQLCLLCLLSQMHRCLHFISRQDFISYHEAAVCRYPQVHVSAGLHL